MKALYVISSLFFAGLLLTGCSSQPKVEWVSETANMPWSKEKAPEAVSSDKADVIVDTTRTAQTIQGFGSCFSELGWAAISGLDQKSQDSIMRELYAPGVGANFTICRMPVAANDFASDWYSYDEKAGDFNLDSFSISRDQISLVPFIKAAKKYRSNLKIWASPWSPPTWMKKNGHYAMESTAAQAKMFAKMKKDNGGNLPAGLSAMAAVNNGLPENKQGFEGTDQFILEEPYLKAYAKYFGKFIDAYKAQGIDIFAVMPQNEFNSAQIFPSCCWTAAGLAQFIKYLGPEMKSRNVDLFFGTMERPNAAMVDTILTDPNCAPYVKGAAFQWAGKDALPTINQHYPKLTMIMSEQECGDGQNDWKGAEHSWDLMKHYMNNGVAIYDYWNTALIEGIPSHWGWRQNSLVNVAYDGNAFNFTYEYYLLKLMSHYVMPGAKKIITEGAYKDHLAFVNPDGSVVVIVANPTDAAKAVSIKVNGKTYAPSLKAHSFNTLVFH